MLSSFLHKPTKTFPNQRFLPPQFTATNAHDQKLGNGFFLSLLLTAFFALFPANQLTADERALALSLEQAIEIALKNNRSIISARNSLDFAKLNLNSTVSEFDLKVKPFAGGGPSSAAGAR